LIEVEYFGTSKSEGFESFLTGHPSTNADGGIAEEPAGVVDGVIGVEGRQDTPFLELGSVAPFEVAGFEFSTRGVEKDNGARNLGCRDLVGYFPSFGDMVEDDLEAEFFL
jgi:hypothetical protein